MNDLSEIKKNSISYLTFKLGEELFASHVMHVVNIVEVPKITKVPKTPEYIKGVINLRGEVLPVIDIRLKFGMEATQFTSNTCVLVLQVQLEKDIIQVGALVDSVQEVLEFTEKDILDPPKMDKKNTTQFITGVVRVDDDFVMILDMNLIFSLNELDDLSDQISSISKELEKETVAE